MGLINKTRITENISVVIGHREIIVNVTENFPFDIKIGFQQVDEVQLDMGLGKKVFKPEYKMAIQAVDCEKPEFTNEEELKIKDKQHKELKTLFAFAKANKQNWFDTALFDGVLSEKVNV
ncbi:hypothetical protein [Streptococcus anginosus]|uniref:hypothetical protein n=1 Tax=Streptococcus anginosus TaxID=1328 RepID=UPI003D363CC5